VSIDLGVLHFIFLEVLQLHCDRICTGVLDLRFI
jgi:hypothetical protein